MWLPDYPSTRAVKKNRPFSVVHITITITYHTVLGPWTKYVYSSELCVAVVRDGDQGCRHGELISGKYTTSLSTYRHPGTGRGQADMLDGLL